MPEVYTVGHYGSYREAIAQHAAEGLLVEKLKGGYAFQNIKDAKRLIKEQGQDGRWAVWAMDANWETDTDPVDNGWWHLLNKNAHITRFICL